MSVSFKVKIESRLCVFTVPTIFEKYYPTWYNSEIVKSAYTRRSSILRIFSWKKETASELLLFKGEVYLPSLRALDRYRWISLSSVFRSSRVVNVATWLPWRNHEKRFEKYCRFARHGVIQSRVNHLWASWLGHFRLIVREWRKLFRFKGIIPKTPIILVMILSRRGNFFHSE